MKEIGLTFVVGAFCILGLEFILYQLFAFKITGFFHGKVGFQGNADDKDGNSSTISATLFVMVSLAIGIIAEDISYKFMDGDWLPGWVPATWFEKLDDKAVVLVGRDTEDNVVPLSLGKELSHRGAFTHCMYDRNVALAVETWFKKGGSLQSADLDENKLNASIKSLYYSAKNAVYTIPSYYDEMKVIQSRLEFSRSITLIALSYFTFALIIILVTLIYLKLNGPGRRKNSQSTMEGNNKSVGADIPIQSIHLSSRNIFVVLVTLCAIFSLSFRAYKRESEEYHKRAFGYFSSILNSQIKIDNEKQK